MKGAIKPAFPPLTLDGLLPLVIGGEAEIKNRSQHFAFSSSITERMTFFSCS